MINIFHHFKEVFLNTLKKIAAENDLTLSEKDLKNFNVEPTKEEKHGDIACNIAMVHFKKFSTIDKFNNPRKLAAEIIKKLPATNIKKTEIAGPGFINLFLEEENPKKSNKKITKK